MSGSSRPGKYDDVLSSILVNEKSILGFLSTIFGFLARRTDFYYIPKDKYENIGFPPGVAEELVIKVLRACDPKTMRQFNLQPEAVQDDIMCSTVAQEVEVMSEDQEVPEEEIDETSVLEPDVKNQASELKEARAKMEKQHEDDRPGQVPTLALQASDAFNGAVTDKYSWAQSIMDLDVTIKLPPDIKSGKDLKVTITATELCVVVKATQEVLLQDTFPYKVKASESVWSVSGGKLSIQLEKQQERWWNALLKSETPIDLSKIDCSRPLTDLSQDQQDKIRELQYGYERKLRGEPTPEEVRQLDALKKAWDLDGSPFKGKPFDPSVLKP